MNTPSALTLQWHAREAERFTSGTYKPIPVNLDYPASHFAHLSTTETEADYVAYTPSDQYGQADRQVRLKFGRYLKKTFESLSDAEIQTHVTSLKSALAIADKPATLHFATDVETINQIFETRMFAWGGTDNSCMYGKFDGDDIRPYHVYANSPDVAVAYVTVAGAIVSRSVVSTKDKVWVRCYAIASGDNDTECGTLRSLLADAGYEEGDLYGNRLSKLDTCEVMLPYIDNGGAEVSDEGKWWRVVESGGDYTAECTDGTATSCTPQCERCGRDEDECSCSYCDCCEESYADGCDRCSMCPECDRCTEHNGCDCARCTDCSELLEARSRYTTTCRCSRCDECNELTDECTCEPDEDEDEEETESTPIVTISVPEELLRIERYLVSQYTTPMLTDKRFASTLDARSIVGGLVQRFTDGEFVVPEVVPIVGPEPITSITLDELRDKLQRIFAYLWLTKDQRQIESDRAVLVGACDRYKADSVAVEVCA